MFDFSLKIIVFGHNHEVVQCYCFNFDSLFIFLYSLIMRIEASHSFSVNTDVCVNILLFRVVQKVICRSKLSIFIFSSFIMDYENLFA